MMFYCWYDFYTQFIIMRNISFLPVSPTLYCGLFLQVILLLLARLINHQDGDFVDYVGVFFGVDFVFLVNKYCDSVCLCAWAVIQ